VPDSVIPSGERSSARGRSSTVEGPRVCQYHSPTIVIPNRLQPERNLLSCPPARMFVLLRRHPEGGWPTLDLQTTLQGAPFKLRLGGVFGGRVAHPNVASLDIRTRRLISALRKQHHKRRVPHLPRPFRKVGASNSITGGILS